MFRTQIFKMIRNQLCHDFSTVREAPVLFEYKGKGVKVILNNPKKLNALDLDMISLIRPEVDKWNRENKVKFAVFTGAGGKAFCAGGDIKSLLEGKQDQSKAFVHQKFFREEYLQDNELAKMKPIQIAFWDGIVMGGGVGISIHAPIKIATENSMFAMPEAKIGLFTDIAGGYFLSRLRNNLGYFLGLTGHRLKGQELVQVGLADYYVKREKLQSLEEEIFTKVDDKSKVEDIKKIVEKYRESVAPGYANEEVIAETFGKNSLEEIFAALKDKNTDFTKKLVQTMETFSPISMKVIFEQIKRGKNLDLAENFKMDYRLAQRFMEGKDFFEGVRCTLIDTKDTPKWQHKSINEVDSKLIEHYFSKLPNEKELVLQNL